MFYNVLRICDKVKFFLKNRFDYYDRPKERRPEKTAGVGRICGGIASLFLDFLVTFLSRKKLQETNAG